MIIQHVYYKRQSYKTWYLWSFKGVDVLERENPNPVTTPHQVRDSKGVKIWKQPITIQGCTDFSVHDWDFWPPDKPLMTSFTSFLNGLKHSQIYIKANISQK